MLAAQVEQVGVVAHAVEAVAVGHLVLVEQVLVRAEERRRDHEVAAAVVERGDAQRRKQDGRGSFLFDGGQAQLTGALPVAGRRTPPTLMSAVALSRSGSLPVALLSAGRRDAAGLRARREWASAPGGANFHAIRSLRAGRANAAVRGGNGGVRGQRALLLFAAAHPGMDAVCFRLRGESGRGRVASDDAVRSRWASVARGIGCDVGVARPARGCACGGMGSQVRCARVGGCSLMRGALMGGTLRGLGDDQPACVGAAKRARRPGQQRHSAELQAGQRHHGSHGGFCAHHQFLEVRRHQSNFYPTWNVGLQ